MTQVLRGLLLLLASGAVAATDPGHETTPAAGPGGFSIEATLVGGPNLNPNLEGRASPVVVRLFELKRVSAFQRAEFTALFERSQQALGEELATQEEFILRPGQIHHYNRTGSPGTTALGVAAAFRTLEGDNWRLLVPLAPDKHNLLLIDFDDSRVRIASVADGR